MHLWASSFYGTEFFYLFKIKKQLAHCKSIMSPKRLHSVYKVFSPFMSERLGELMWACPLYFNDLERKETDQCIAKSRQI